jgi:ribosomal protein S18 acetylase RimI-like enzyme
VTKPTLPARRALAGDAEAIARLYLGAFKAALPDVVLAHTDEQVRAWIEDVVVARRETWIVESGDGIVGFLTLDGSDVEQLYVAVGHWRRGIGSMLLDLAKQRSPERLELYTFQANARAVRFYERHGFEIVAAGDGSGNEERAPDFRMRWPAPRRVALGPPA